MGHAPQMVSEPVSLLLEGSLALECTAHTHGRRRQRTALQIADVRRLASLDLPVRVAVDEEGRERMALEGDLVHAGATRAQRVPPSVLVHLLLTEATEAVLSDVLGAHLDVFLLEEEVFSRGDKRSQVLGHRRQPRARGRLGKQLGVILVWGQVLKGATPHLRVSLALEQLPEHFLQRAALQQVLLISAPAKKAVIQMMKNASHVGQKPNGALVAAHAFLVVVAIEAEVGKGDCCQDFCQGIGAEDGWHIHKVGVSSLPFARMRECDLLHTTPRRGQRPVLLDVGQRLPGHGDSPAARRQAGLGPRVTGH